ncbi:MAG: hypothetical protein ACLQOO_26300 [Terriglobia bacterium]
MKVETNRSLEGTDSSLRVCSYEDRPEAMDSLILMGESLCRVDREVSLHLTVPEAPASVRAWAERRPEVVLSTSRPDGVSGWDVKPWLLLQELKAGRREAIWIDDDMIVTRPVSSMLEEFPRDSLIVAQEWVVGEAIPACPFWGLPLGRRVPWINACVLRITQAHRPLLERYLEMTHDPRYRAVQALPLEGRPIHLLGDTPLLRALLESKEFGVPFDYLRLGRHIAQCAGSSGYRPQHRVLDLFRGLPPLIHCIGRKPWMSRPDQGGIHGFLIDVADDVSPYVLAARRVARDLDMTPAWLDARTSLGAMLRWLTAYHPAMAGLPLAILHALQLNIGQMMRSSPREADKGW